MTAFNVQHQSPLASSQFTDVPSSPLVRLSPFPHGNSQFLIDDKSQEFEQVLQSGRGPDRQDCVRTRRSIFPSKSHPNCCHRVMGATGSEKTTVSEVRPGIISGSSPVMRPVYQSREWFESTDRNGPGVVYDRGQTRG